MTTEESLMRAVVEAAREWRDHYGNSAAVSYDRGVEAMQARRNLAAAVDAIAALDAHRAEPAGEVRQVTAQLVPNSRSPDVPRIARICPKPAVKESLTTPQPVEIPIADGGRDRD